MTESKMMEMVGYNYMVDIEHQAVYRKKDGKLIKPSVSECNSKRYHLTRQDGKRRCISANRVMYSAMIGISPDTIPQDIYVICDKGIFRLEYHAEMNARNHAKARTNHIKKWRDIIAQRLAETQMLMDYYDTDDVQHIMKYVVESHDRLTKYIKNRYHCSSYTAHDVASEVIDDICQRIACRNFYVSSISTAMRGYARNAMTKRRMTTTYREL